MADSPDNAVASLYGLLGIDASSAFDDVKRAFRFAIRANHPDRNPRDPFAAQRFRSINAAWELVNTPGKRTAHGERTEAPPPQAQQPTEPQGRSAPRHPPLSGRVLRIERANVARDGIARWKVQLDGKMMAKLGLGQSIQLELSAGSHELSVAGFGNRSRPVAVELADGEEAVFKCWLTFWKAYFQPRQSINLERIT